jgi:hypothetical protein
MADYSRFAHMLLNGGELDGLRLLGRKTVERIASNYLPIAAGEHSTDGMTVCSCNSTPLVSTGTRFKLCDVPGALHRCGQNAYITG